MLSTVPDTGERISEAGSTTMSADELESDNRSRPSIVVAGIPVLKGSM